MPTQPKIEVQISAKADQLSTSLAKVRKDIAGLPAMAQQASRKTGGMNLFGGGRTNASMFGLDRVQSQIGRMNGMARTGLGSFGMAARAIPGLGLVAGAASVAGLGEMMTSLGGAGVELTNTARLAGTTAAGLNSMRGAARLMGLSAGTADQAMLGLNHTLQDAVYGRNADAANWFNKTGINIGSISTGAKSAEAVLPQMVDTLTRLAKNNPLAAERLAGVWGIPSAALPMLIRGSGALQANRKEVERMFGSMDAYQASSERFTYSTARMSLASEKLGMTVMTSLEPHLTPMLLSLSTWVEKHDKDIGAAFDRIGKAVANVPWAKVGDDLDRAGKVVAGIDWDKVGHGLNTVGRAASGALDFVDRLLTDLERLQTGKKPIDITGDLLKQASPREWADIVANHPERAEYASPRERAGAGMSPVGSPGRSFGASAPTPNNPEQERRARRGRDILVGLGWTPAQAAGIMANVGSESRFNEGAVGDSGQAYGIAQWHSDRLAKIRAGMGRDVVGMNFDDQIKVIDYELRNNEKAAGDALRRTTTAAAAGDVVSRQYERPGATEAEATNRARSADVYERRWSGGPARSPQLTLPETSSATAPSGGNLQITIDHQNVPAGVTMTPKLQSHSAELAGINVRRAMPHAGKMPPWGFID